MSTRKEPRTVTPGPTRRSADGPARGLPMRPCAAPAAIAAGAGLLAAAIGLGVFVTRTGAVGTGELALDVALSHDRNAFFVAAAHAVDLGLASAVAPIWVALIAVAIAVGHRRAGAAFAAVSGLGWLSVAIAKLVFHRVRPPMSTVHALALESGPTSFPSGHTAIAASMLAGAVVAALLMQRSTRWIWVVGVPSVVFVAFTRLYLGVHYLGDVAASVMFVGGTALILTGLATILWSQLGMTTQTRKTRGLPLARPPSATG